VEEGEGVVGKCWATQGDQHGAQSGEELFAVAIRDGGGVLGWFRWLRRQSTPQASPLKPRTKLLGWGQPR